MLANQTRDIITLSTDTWSNFVFFWFFLILLLLIISVILRGSGSLLIGDSDQLLTVRWATVIVDYAFVVVIVSVVLVAIILVN